MSQRKCSGQSERNFEGFSRKLKENEMQEGGLRDFQVYFICSLSLLSFFVICLARPSPLTSEAT